jgi:hypothetical protein
VPLPLLWGINRNMKPLSEYSVISTDVGRDAGREVAGSIAAPLLLSVLPRLNLGFP